MRGREKELASVLRGRAEERRERGLSDGFLPAPPQQLGGFHRWYLRACAELSSDAGRVTALGSTRVMKEA